MIIIGIDPGTSIIGYSIIEKDKSKLTLIDYGCITTKAKIQDTEKLIEIYTDLGKIIEKFKPEKAGIEKIFFNKNVKTAIDVAQARGVILLKLRENNIEIEQFTPAEIKISVTSYGQADKKMVQESIKKFFKLKHIPKPDDAADAIAAGICAANTLKTK